MQGNYVGTNAAGDATIANGGVGIVVFDGFNNLIGGTAPGAGNLASGIAPTGPVVRVARGNNVTVVPVGAR